MRNCDNCRYLEVSLRDEPCFGCVGYSNWKPELPPSGEGQKGREVIVNNCVLPDSGKREGFDSGSIRDSREGKGRYDLISPFALKRIAVHYENGAKKYADRNWEKGQPIMRYFDSAVRHLFTWVTDKLCGRPHAEDHLAAAAWNVMAMLDHEERIAIGRLPTGIDDSPGPAWKPE